MMMATSDMNKNPALFLEPGNNLTTGHKIIVHTIHITSILMSNCKLYQPSLLQI